MDGNIVFKVYGWRCGRSLSSKKLISPLVRATTLRKISVKAGITKLEHNLCHLGAGKKELDWTGLTSQKLLEGFTGELLWALPGAVRDDADGAW